MGELSWAVAMGWMPWGICAVGFELIRRAVLGNGGMRSKRGAVARGLALLGASAIIALAMPAKLQPFATTSQFNCLSGPGLW